ncbi:MAG: DUF2089 family protein [Sedimentisphaerales bacterium]|nr:DUF2089 family protein [Sedimentisphaerales bacterium]
MKKTWIDWLSDEDMGFIKRFILASGSLKEMARYYGISYPTVRLRLDRLIEKIKIHDSNQDASEFELLLQNMYTEQRIDMAGMKTLLETHRKELENENNQSDTNL